MENELNVKLEVALEGWGMYLVDRGYAIGPGTDIASLLPEWIDCLAHSVHAVGPCVSAVPFIRVLLDYWAQEMQNEVRHIIEKGWTKDLVPDRWVPAYAEQGRDTLDEAWVANLMVEHKWLNELLEAMLQQVERCRLD